MNVLLLAAGMGSRLRPITQTIPKCMVPILGRPLIDYWFELFQNCNNINKIFINTHHLPEPVRDYVQTSPVTKKVTLLHEERLIGTGGTLGALVVGLETADLLVAHADNLTLFDINEFRMHHASRPVECVGTMMTFNAEDPTCCGIVEVNAKGIVTSFHEKVSDPPGNLANAAIFLFDPKAFSIIAGVAKKKAVSDISLDIIPLLVNKLFTYHNRVYHRDIGSLRSLKSAEADFPAVYEKFNRTYQKDVTK
jgi:mannose-1-phosphate guanylyltransferase